MTFPDKSLRVKLSGYYYYYCFVWAAPWYRLSMALGRQIRHNATLHFAPVWDTNSSSISRIWIWWFDRVCFVFSFRLLSDIFQNDSFFFFFLFLATVARH